MSEYVTVGIDRWQLIDPLLPPVFSSFSMEWHFGQLIHARMSRWLRNTGERKPSKRAGSFRSSRQDL